MPYMIARTDEVEGPLFLRKFGVPFWALAHHPPQHAEILNVTSWVNVDKRDPLTRR
jgi:hypothetical protein